MPGGLGGSQSTQVKLPSWLNEAAQRTVDRGEDAARIGYVPWTGPDVAAFSPMQNAAFQGTNQAAAAFGMPTSQGTGMPAPTTFAGGMQGYSSAPMFNAAVEDLRTSRPGQYAAIQSMFVNPTARPQAAAQPGTQPRPGTSPEPRPRPRSMR